MPSVNSEADERRTISNLSLRVLDFFLNVASTYDPERIIDTMSSILGEPRNLLFKSFDELTQLGDLVKSDSTWKVNPKTWDALATNVHHFLNSQNITPANATLSIEKQTDDTSSLAVGVDLAGRVSEPSDQKIVSFTDHEWVRQPGPFCDELARLSLMFRIDWESKKHSYREYYFRKWPFEVYEVLRDVLLKRLNVSGLSNVEWNVVSLLFLGKGIGLTHEVLRRNTELSHQELREIISVLKDRGLVDEEYERVFLRRGLQEALVSYYDGTVYPARKIAIIAELKQKLGKSLSALETFLVAKKIYDLPLGQNRPFGSVIMKVVRRTELKEHELQLESLLKMQLVIDLDDEILIQADVLKDLGKWVRGSLQQSVTFIPAKDMWLARNVLQGIFSQCQEYVKVQDPYVGEETFFLLEYIPREIQIMLLTSQMVGAGEDPQRIVHQIQRFKQDRRDFQVQFIGDKVGEAPFHYRYIMTKDKCWHIDTSLKQIGKGKDTLISEHSKEEKEELFEPAFDLYWRARENQLRERGLSRLPFETWKGRVLGSPTHPS